jgi:outer membrane protein TolC
VQAVKQAEIAERAFQRSKDTIEIDKALIDSGRIPKNELVQAKADQAIRELAAVTANNARDTARLTLVRLFTLDKATQFTIPQDLVVTEVTPDAAKLTSLAIAQQPSYVQQKLQLSLTELGLAVARNNRLWALNFVATYGGSSADYPYQTALDELYGRKNTAATVGLAVSIPVFGNLVPEQGVVNAKIALRKAQLSLDDLRDALEVQVLENVRDVDVNFRQVRLARTARQLTEEKLLFERDKLKSGLSSTFEVVQFEDDLINAQNSELSAIISYQNALTVLDQTVGSTLDTWKIQFNPNPETPR